MSGGSTVIGPWPTKQSAAASDADRHILDSALIETAGDTEYGHDAFDEDGLASSSSPWRYRIALFLCITAAIAWIGIGGFVQYTDLEGRAPQLDDITRFIAMISAPLALIGVIWVLALRTSKSESRRFSKTIDDLRTEEIRLGRMLSTINQRINASKSDLADQGDTLMALGDEAAQKLNIVSGAMRGEIEGISRHSNALKTSAAAARADMAVLLSDLPKAQVQTRQMVSDLQEAGLTAHEKAGALDSQLAALSMRGREAEEIAGGAAQKLAAHLARMEGVSEAAGARLEQSANQMTKAVDTALERAADALTAGRQGMEAQGAAMMAMVQQGQAAMSAAGAEAAEAIATRVSAASKDVDHIAESFAAQDITSKALVARLSADISDIEQRIAALGEGSVATSERASAAVLGLRDHADALTTSLEAGGKTAEALISQAEMLLTALDASAREIDETIPAAYSRLQETANASQIAAKQIIPDIQAIETASAKTLGQLRESETLVSAQRANFESISAIANDRLSESRASAEALAVSLDTVTAKADALATAAGPQLLEALVRVKETAIQAAEHARTALADVIPKSAAALGEQSRDALVAALTRQVEEQMGEIARTAENAVSAAQNATDRLMRQMLTISETSAALEARIAEAKEEVERSDETSFARRVALLIESLNSTAIDVTKILSNEVTDTAWASYLRGDRGVFTRRAVRLLDTGEVREIVRYYEEEAEFREQVNRYIHDFESMLRNVLATRDGSPLSVTLLSSDAGKLYVALAQAIERLRS